MSGAVPSGSKHAQKMFDFISDPLKSAQNSFINKIWASGYDKRNM